MNLKSPYWIKPKNIEIIPSSELAMHVGAARRFLQVYCRTGENYVHIIFGDKDNPQLTHGLISELLPITGTIREDCLKSAIVSQELLFR